MQFQSKLYLWLVSDPNILLEQLKELLLRFIFLKNKVGLY